VKDKLAPYKYPRWIEFVPALPKRHRQDPALQAALTASEFSFWGSQSNGCRPSCSVSRAPRSPRDDGYEILLGREREDDCRGKWSRPGRVGNSPCMRTPAHPYRRVATGNQEPRLLKLDPLIQGALAPEMVSMPSMMDRSIGRISTISTMTRGTRDVCRLDAVATSSAGNPRGGGILPVCNHVESFSVLASSYVLCP